MGYFPSTLFACPQKGPFLRAHCVPYADLMLLPFEIVRETEPDSEQFNPLKNGGLSSEAKLPVFKSESGAGIGDGSTSGGYSLEKST